MARLSSLLLAIAQVVATLALICSAMLPLQAMAGDRWVPAPLNHSRNGAALVVLADGRVLAAGGGHTGTLSSVEVFDPSNRSWTFVASMHNDRMRAQAVLLPNGKVLVASGMQSAMIDAVATATVEVYDPIANTWTEIAPLATGREFFTLNVLLDGSVIAVGGRRSNTPGMDEGLSSSERLANLDGTWEPGPTLSHARYAHTATSLPDGRIAVLGGARQFGDEIAPGEMIAADASGSSLLAPMPHPMSSGSAIKLPDTGEIVLMGGFASPSGAVPFIDAYDPATNQWRTVGSLNTGAYGSCASLLNGGRILVAGGWSNSVGARLETSEVFDPDTGSTWFVQRRMSIGRAGPRIRIPDGSVLVVDSNRVNDPNHEKGADLFIGEGTDTFFDGFE